MGIEDKEAAWKVGREARDAAVKLCDKTIKEAKKACDIIKKQADLVCKEAKKRTDDKQAKKEAEIICDLAKKEATIMRSKQTYTLIVVVLIGLSFGAGRLSAATSGTLDSPAPPGSTSSYSLEDIYDRLMTGAAGAPSAFAEPPGGPTAGTGHTLDEVIAQAPAEDNTDGATPVQVPPWSCPCRLPYKRGLALFLP